MDDPRQQLLDDTPARPVRSGPNRAVMTIVAASILAVLLLIVVFNIDHEAETPHGDDFDDLVELVGPSPMSDRDRTQGSTDLQRGFQAELARGGWVQIADRETGELQQQYRCERLDPNPEGLGSGWLRLDRPEMEIYLTGNRVVTLTGGTAVAYAPHRGIEQGTITDDVVLRLYEAGEDGRIDLNRDEPAMTVRTDEASFDHFLGEIRCDDWVDIRTPQLQMPAERLNLLVSDQDNTVQLRVASFDYIRLRDEPDHDSSALAGSREREPRPVKWHIDRAAAPRGPGDAGLQPLHTGRPGRPSRMVQPASRTSRDEGNDASFYLLAVEDEVRIDQGSPTTRREAQGDRLRMIFSNRTEGLNETRAETDAPRRELGAGGRTVTPASYTGAGRSQQNGTTRPVVAAHPASASSASSSSSSASTGGSERASDRASGGGDWMSEERLVRGPLDDSMREDLLGEGITLVRGEGPLTIVPLEDRGARPPSAQDVWLELVGRPVVVTDRTGESEAVGRSMRYLSSTRRIEMEGTAEYPLHVISPDLEAGGQRFVMSQADDRGGFEGPGWLVRRGSPLGEERFGGGRTSRLDHEENGPSGSSPSPELQITWEESMDLEFEERRRDDESQRGSRLREAVFRGKVRVSSDEFLLNAEEMIVGFPAGTAEMDRIESIRARRDVRVLGVGTQGAIHCDELTLDLTTTPDGRSIPTLMVATGDVEAIDDDQIIWADSLRVTFLSDDTAAPADEADEAEADGPFARSGLKVDRLIARENVQVLLSDGSRAYADLLEGDGREESVELTGRNVALVSDKMIIDQGERIILNRKDGKLSAPSRGLLRIYREPVIDPRRERTPRPVIDSAENPLEVRTRWRDSMTYDGHFNEGAGAIDFRGDVDVRAEPRENELNLMTGDSLTLEFAFVDRLPDDVAPGQSAEPVASRELSLMLARGDAKLESRAWNRPEQRDDPRIFYVAGQHVEYRPLRREAVVIGDGELLIHDPHAGEAEARQTPFGTGGSTMMTWRRQLRLEHRIDNVYDLFASDEVEIRHHALDGAISTMTGNEVAAVIVRAEREDAGGEGTAAGAQSFDFGGDAQLERLRGDGGVIIKTDQREIDCDSFDYDITNGLARASARPGRVLAVQTTGAPGVLTAEEILWNMRRDSIRITRAAGTTPR